jgi:hypothetical protein
MVVVTAIATVARYGGSLMLALRVGRDYGFFLLFFPYSVALQEESNASAFRRFFLKVMTIFAIGYIAQSFLPLNSIYYHSYTEEQTFGGIKFNRIYLNYLEFYSGPMILSCLIAAALCSGRRALSMVLCGMFLVQATLTYHRGLWAAVVLGAATCIIVGLRTFEKGERKALQGAAAVSIIVVLIVTSTPLLDAVINRMSEGLADTPLTGGSITGRTLTSATYLEALMDNLVAGVGLLHRDSGVLATDDEMAYFSELGSIGYLFHFGVGGLIWMICLAVVYYRLAKQALRSQLRSGIDRAIVLGSFGYFGGTLLVSFVNGGLSTPAGIGLFALGFAYTVRTARDQEGAFS